MFTTTKKFHRQTDGAGPNNTLLSAIPRSDNRIDVVLNARWEDE